MAARIKEVFTKYMDKDLDVRGAFDALCNLLLRMNIGLLKPEEASGIISGFKEIDSVLKVVF